MDLATEGLGRLPVDAAVGYRYAAAELIDGLGERVAACQEVALDHGPDDRRVAVGDLPQQRPHHLGLQLRPLLGVVVRAVDKDRPDEPRRPEQLLGPRYLLRRI